MTSPGENEKDSETWYGLAEWKDLNPGGEAVMGWWWRADRIATEPEARQRIRDAAPAERLRAAKFTMTRELLP